jgi:hypothetical protein
MYVHKHLCQDLRKEQCQWRPCSDQRIATASPSDPQLGTLDSFMISSWHRSGCARLNSRLAKLERRGPLTIHALAKDMRIQPTASDRRVKELHLTKAGEKHLAAALKGWVAAQARFEGAYGTKRAADLRGLLRAVVASEFAP